MSQYKRRTKRTLLNRRNDENQNIKGVTPEVFADNKPDSDSEEVGPGQDRVSDIGGRIGAGGVGGREGDRGHSTS